tara:strand:- start:1025 stop:1384 length:360 start_codon:yes stop_codon:yes gene_type:complete
MIDNLSVILFVSISILLTVGAFYLMTSTLRDLPEERAWHPMADGGVNSSEFKKYMKTVTRRVHPEMVDVEPGEKLMGVTFEKRDSCDLEEYKALQQRIEEIRAELEDDDDDDGDVVVRV